RSRALTPKSGWLPGIRDFSWMARSSPAMTSGGMHFLAGEAHLLEDRGAEQAVRVAQRLGQFQVAVMVADQQFNRLAGRLYRRGEIAGLTLEFRGLAGAIGNDQWCAQLVEVALRAQRRDHLVGEFDVGRAVRQ